jgi:NAD+ kinase
MKTKIVYSKFIEDEVKKLNLIDRIRKKLEVVEKVEDADLCISLGGDGSVLYSAQYEVPILGVNVKKESIGAMCIVDTKNMEDALEKIRKGDYMINERMKIEALINHKYFCEALNDFYLFRNPFFDETIRYKVKSNGINFEDKADGVIVCTSMGLTAYNRSALLGKIFQNGNAIIDKILNDKIMAITPICSTLMEKQRVIDINSNVQIKPLRCNEAIFKGDGINKMKVKVGDEITIKKSKNTVEFVVPFGYKVPQQEILENILKTMG